MVVLIATSSVMVDVAAVAFARPLSTYYRML